MSNFNVNLFLEQRISHYPVKQHENNRIAQRGKIRIQDNRIDTSVNHLLDAEILENDGQQLTEYIQKQRVHTETDEEGCPFLAFLHINHIDEPGQQGSGHTAGNQHEGRRPYSLVQRKSVGKHEADGYERKAEDEQMKHLVIQFLVLHQNLSAPEPDQGIDRKSVV